MTTIRSRSARGLQRQWRALVASPKNEATRILWADVRAQTPRFADAVVADARITAANRGDRHEFRSTADAFVQAIRLAIVTDAFLAQCCYRAKAHCQARRIPVAPRILHRLAMITGQICIGDPAVLQAGVYIPHGQIVVDGCTRISSGVVLSPFVTVGLRASDVVGPSIGARAVIGTGAKVIGPVRVGERAKIGANAVVVTDVPDRATAVGVPARIVP